MGSYDSDSKSISRSDIGYAGDMKTSEPARDIAEDGIQDRLNGLASAMTGIEMALDNLRTELMPVRMDRVDGSNEDGDADAVKPLTRSSVNEALLRLIRRANTIEAAIHQTCRELDV